MTQKNEAPERIWAWVHRDGNRMTHVWHGETGGPGKGKTEYIRADHALPMVAAEREAMAGRYLAYADAAPHDAYHHVIAIADDIRARTDADAKAALAARDKRVREKALREAAEDCNEVAQATLGDERGIALACRGRILALIEKDQTDDK